MNTTIHASPAKLRDGSWGARVQGNVRRGSVITVTARNGKTWNAVVDRILWTGEDRNGQWTSLVSTRSRPRHTATHNTRRPTDRGFDHEDCLTFGSCGSRCPY